MYLAIELWQESGLSQGKFCSRENLSVKTFSYWYKKYKKGKGPSLEHNKKVSDTFIPVKVSGDRTSKVLEGEYGRIEVSFPNGVQVSCLVGIDRYRPVESPDKLLTHVCPVVREPVPFIQPVNRYAKSRELEINGLCCLMQISSDRINILHQDNLYEFQTILFG